MERNSTFATVTALSLLAGFGFVAAHAESLTVTEFVSEDQQGAASNYWTRERIADAPAMQLLIDSGTREVAALEMEDTAVTELVDSAPSGMADLNAAFIAQEAYAQDWVTQEDWMNSEQKLAFEEPPTGEVPAAHRAQNTGAYTSYDVNTHSELWRVYPHIWSGKLTFTMPGGEASCSATAISGNNIVTAAHCVYDTSIDLFHSNWVFTPAFRNGRAPFGTFTASACTVLDDWIALSGDFSVNSWSRHDVAVCTMNRNSAGQTLNDAVGWAGRLWDAGNRQLVFNSGYPARAYNDDFISNGPAQYLRSCTSETNLQTKDTLGSACDWGRGISGGSWLVGYRPLVATGQINSVNSGFFVNDQRLYGARFTRRNIVALCDAREC
jgi:hypothetical protein